LHRDWDRCAFLETFHTPFFEITNGVPYGLSRTAQDLGNPGRLLSVSTGKQNLTTAQGEGILRAQTNFERCALFQVQWTDKEGFHVP
jgi:hypothetical protein